MVKETKNILIVEDEVTLLDAISNKLVQEGFKTIKAKNGQEGLGIALKEHPDLIIIDILMPIMDGMTMMTKVREDSWGKAVPIIILTNLSADENIIKGVVKDEPLYFLVKSEWSLKDIVEKIKTVWPEK